MLSLILNQEEGTTMKIERLYAITIYLLNHGKTSASKLAIISKWFLRRKYENGFSRQLKKLLICIKKS